MQLKNKFKLFGLVAFLLTCVSICEAQSVMRGEASPGIYENIKSKNQAIVSGAFDFSYVNITSNATTVVKTGAGFLHCISVNNIGTTEILTIYDNTSATVPKSGSE